MGACARSQVFSMGTEVDPADIAKAALERAEELSAETGKPFTLIVDTGTKLLLKDKRDVIQDTSDIGRNNAEHCLLEANHYPWTPNHL